jgi:hypothetical protein
MKHGKVLAGMAQQQQQMMIRQLDALAAVMMVKFGVTEVTISPSDMADLNGKYTIKREPGEEKGSFKLTVNALPTAEARLPGASKIVIAGR